MTWHWRHKSNGLVQHLLSAKNVETESKMMEQGKRRGTIEYKGLGRRSCWNGKKRERDVRGLFIVVHLVLHLKKDTSTFYNALSYVWGTQHHHTTKCSHMQHQCSLGDFFQRLIQESCRNRNPYFNVILWQLTLPIAFIYVKYLFISFVYYYRFRISSVIVFVLSCLAFERSKARSADNIMCAHELLCDWD